MASDPLTFEEEMAKARAAHGRRKEQVIEQTEDRPALSPFEEEMQRARQTEPTEPAAVTDQPALTFEQEMARARGAGDLAVQPSNQNKGLLGDIGTDIKYGAQLVTQGPIIRSESERGLRDITRDRVASQLSEPDIAGIEKLAGKKINKMDWDELDRTATKFYGTTGEGFLGKRYVWNNKLRSMMGFREGDMEEPSGAPAFPNALDFIGGSLKSGKANVLTGAKALATLPITFDVQGVYEGIARPIMESRGVDTREYADDAAEAINRLREEYTEEQQEQEELPFLNPEATKNPLTWFAGPTKDLKGIFHTIVQQGPMLATMMASAKITGRTGASLYTRSMKKPTSLMEEVQGFQTTGARVGGAIGGGGTEMSLIRDAVFSEVHGRIDRETTDQMWNENEDYRKLVDGGLTPEEAKQVVGYSYSNTAGEVAMVISGALLGTPMGAVYGGTVGRSAGRQVAKDAILKRMGKTAALEIGQEMSQEATEQIASNLAVMRINPDVGMYDGVAESMAAAAFTAGPYGALGGISSNKGAGVAKDYDTMIRISQPWVSAANARAKFQAKKGPNTNFEKDASPQDQLKAMLELERLQEKEAEAYTSTQAEVRELMEKNGAPKDKLLEHDARGRAYAMDTAMIAKRRKSRQLAKRQALEEKRAQAERAAAKKQIERDVNIINDNNRLVENMQAIQRGEVLNEQEGYDELSKLGYGTLNRAGDTYMLTARGVRSLEELARESVDLRDKIESGFPGGNRREDANLREAYQNLSEEEFEDQVMRDPDTKLWNKRKWNQDEKDGKPVAVLDADALKWVNDNMSHSAGTKYLRMISKEIEALGGGVESYRYGGDEFIVTHPDESRLQSIVEQAVARINKLPRLEEAGKSIKVQVSVGYGADFDTADDALQQEKQRRIRTGERADSRIEDSTPPSLRLGEPENSAQMSLFAMSKNYDMFNDDKISDPKNTVGDPELWHEYVQSSDIFYNSLLFGTAKVTDEEMGWVESTVEEYLPSTNLGNPPVTLMHDFTSLAEISPNQYEEMLDIPFGAQHVRGIFSLDDPSHGVFLFADAIIGEAKRGLKYGQRMLSWHSIKYRVKEGDTVEVIDPKGKIRKGIVTAFTAKKPAWSGQFGWRGVIKKGQTEKRLSTLAIKTRQKLNKLIRKEESLLKARKRMTKAKREDRSHPINMQLAKNFETQNQLETEVRMYQSALMDERRRMWKEEDAPKEAKKKEVEEKDSITVEVDGDVVVFDPTTNAIVSSAQETKDVHIGRLRHTGSSSWYDNLGNEEAAKDEELTADHVERVVADTILHEAVGHFGIRGLTKDYETYIELTHAIADAFPEVVDNLRAIGYTYRTDINKGEDLDRANKALLGEEVMAWTAGELLSKPELKGLTLPQQNAIRRFITWFKEQLLRLGWNKIYRKQKANQIRSARKQLRRARTAKQREAAVKKLDELVYRGASGIRKGKKGGVVIRAGGGFLNDKDLLNIIARSHDAIVKGHSKWQFKDFHGNSHNLYMRDMEIFRKPIYDVMLNGVRERTEEELLTEEDLAPAPPVPTLAEAYKEATGENMPEGWKPLTPGDFKDEAKAQAAAMLEGKSKDEIAKIKKDRLLPNPKMLFDAATAAMSEEEKGLAGKVQSIIGKAKKEVERKKNLIKSKRAKIAEGERQYGEAFNQDTIPVFPEMATIQGFVEAAKRALPSATEKGHISEMELEAAGFMERVWPSRVGDMMKSIYSTAPVDALAERIGITEKRLEELRQPGTMMTEEEANKLSKFMKSANEMNEAFGELGFTEEQLDPKTLVQNNALTVESFVGFFGQYVLSQQDSGLATLHGLLGENHPTTEAYRKALLSEHSADPDVRETARLYRMDLLKTPVDVTKVNVPKVWVMQRIKDPVYEVSVSAPIRVAHDWKVHYERLFGTEPDSNYYGVDDLPSEEYDAVMKEIRRDQAEGPDVGYDPNLDRWLTTVSDPRTMDYFRELMPWYIVDNSYKGAVFWQRPSNGVSSSHFGHAKYRGERNRADDETSGIWGHARYGETYDADPDAPTAPNPDKQGLAMMNFENQGDYPQRASKKWSSEEEYENAKATRIEDGYALTSVFNGYINAFDNVYRRLWTEEFNALVDRVDDDEVINYMGDAAYQAATTEERELQKQGVVARNVADGHDALGVNQKFKDALKVLHQEIGDNKMYAQAAADMQESQDSDSLTEVGVTPATKRNLAFVGDARMFEWADKKAMGMILEKVRAISDAYDYHIQEFSQLNGVKSQVDRLKTMGGKITNLGVKNRVLDVKASFTRYAAKPSGDNQPGHRIPFMESRARQALSDFIVLMGSEQGAAPNHSAASTETEQVFERLNSQQSYRLTISGELIADAVGRNKVTPRRITLMVREWGGTPLAMSLNAQVNLPNETEAVVSIYADKETLDEEGLEQRIRDDIEEFTRVKFTESSMEDLLNKIYEKKQKLEKRWDYNRRQMEHWLPDFDVRFARLGLTEEPDAPFKHLNPELTRELSVDDAQTMMAEHQVETFDKFVQRKWQNLWVNSTDTELESYREDGGDEATPTPGWYERYASEFTDNPPAVVTMVVPYEWDENNVPTKTKLWVVKKVRAGKNFDIFIEPDNATEYQEETGKPWYQNVNDGINDGERQPEYHGISYNAVVNKITMYIQQKWSDDGVDIDPFKLPSLKANTDLLMKEVADLEKRRDKGQLEGGETVKKAFANNAAFDSQRGDFDSMEKSFLRVIEKAKKSGYQKRVLIEKNEQWRVTEILWAFNEAVRNGYARMHLAYGSESGARGGFGRNKYDATHYVHSANEVKFELAKKRIRGKERDVIILEADTVSSPVWIDITEDTLLPLNPDRTLSDLPEQHEGYFSGQLARQVGKDVAEVIARKLSDSHSASRRNMLLISRAKWNPDASGSQQQLMESWLIHDTSGNILEIAASQDEASAIRERLFNDEGEADQVRGSVTKGVVNSSDVGGPIQFNRTYYSGGPAFEFEYGDNYQHTFARPTYEGGRANYDLVLPSRINGHLKRFGLKIETGYAKIKDVNKLDVVYATGGRVSYNLPKALGAKYPNVRVDEVTGENYGFIINSEKGLVMPTIFPTRVAAEQELHGWYSSNAADNAGRVKVYQVTFNDELRKFHERPQNPFLGVKWQIEGNEKLKAALAKIGSDEPSLLDRFNDWRKTWKASVNIGMFDRFYGILYALKMTGSDTEGYLLTRMTTGLDAMMKGIFEYGSPVWRDGVVVNEGRGLLKILERVADQIELWAGYMAGVRAKRLMLEGYDKLSASDKVIIDRAVADYEGETHNEKLFNLLVAVTGTEEEAVAAEGPPTFDRRDVLKGMLAFGVAASVPLPGSSSLDKAAVDLVLPMLKKSNFKKFRAAAAKAQQAGRLATTAEALDLDRIVDPTKAFKNPQAARHNWIKKLMNAEGVTREQAEAAIDSAIKKGFEDQLATDLAKAAKEKVDKKTEGTSTPDVNRAVNNLIRSGREHLFTPTDIDQLVQLGEDHAVFKEVASEYAEWNRKLLDFAEESGVINAETRPLWEEADYIPFYRIADDRLVGPLAKTTGIANQTPPVKTLKGGQNNLGDLVHNIFMNATSLMDSSVKNHAALKVVDTLVPTGLMTKESHDIEQALVPMEEIKKLLKRNGIRYDDLELDVIQGLQSMLAITPPVGEGVMAVLRNGKKEYYKTDDMLLWRSMTALNMERFGDWIAPARFAKRGLTTMITLDPGFMVANYVRDSMSAYVLSRDHFVPFISGVKGFREAITEGDTYKAMVGSGSAFESGNINQGSPETTHRYIKSAMRDAGFQRTLLNTPMKLFDAWKRLGSATENANRIAVYQAAIDAGKTQQQALYEAKDIMDFSMGGDYQAVQILIQTVPFMGARMQGLHRLGRGAAEHPVGFLFKGTLLGLAGMALWLRWRDDPRYDELEDWDKDAYFHWWIGDQHFRLPKGFEVGAIFNTIPERIMEYYYSRETDAGKLLMRRMGHMIMETFNMNPIPQIAKPMVEMLANYNFFRGRSIESPYERDLLPEDRYKYYTSETMRELTAAMPEGINTTWYGVIKSPKQLENMWAGYTGTIGRYILNAADIGVRYLGDYPVAPDWDMSDLPVLGRFFRGDRPRRTRYEQEFYRELDTTVQVMNSLRKAERQLDVDDPRYDEIEAYYAPYVERAQEFQSFNSELGRLNKEVRETYLDKDLSRKEKRKELDELQLERNELMKEAYEARPSASDDQPMELDTLMDRFDPSVPDANQELRSQAPQTSELFAGIGEMSPAQLDKLMKSANYSPRKDQ